MFSVVVSPPSPRPSSPPPAAGGSSAGTLSATAMRFASAHDSHVTLGHTARPSSSDSTITSMRTPMANSALTLFQPHPSAPPLSPPVSPRSMRTRKRFPTRLFPQTTHVDHRGHLMPPPANADLPTTLTDKRGDSFMVDDTDIVTATMKHTRNNSGDEKDSLSWGDVIDTVLNIHGAVEAIKEKRKKKTASQKNSLDINIIDDSNNNT